MLFSVLFATLTGCSEGDVHNARRSEGTTILASPDGSLSAVVTRVECEKQDRNCMDDDSIQLWTAGGELLWTGEAPCLHMEEAAWTPDSQFFVFSGYNSGGHQPYSNPIYCYSRSQNDYIDLYEALGVDCFGSESFHLEEPDLFLGWELDFSQHPGTGRLYPVQVNLADIHREATSR